MMLVGKKRVLIYTLPSIILLVSASYLLLPPQLKLSYVPDAAHLAEKDPEGTWRNMTCPQCKSQLEGITIYTSKYIDAAWRFAFYCRQEDIFWIYNFAGGISYSRWYGPFNAYWKITNIVAISGIIISGVALVLVAIVDRGLMKRYFH